jgi:hypothetical protein
VLAVQSQLGRLAMWRLIDLELQTSALEERERSMHRFLQEETVFAGMFSSIMMRRLQALAEQLAVLRTEKETQLCRQLEERRRARHAECLVAALEDNSQRDEALRELTEAIETATWRPDKAPTRLPRHSDNHRN